MTDQVVCYVVEFSCDNYLLLKPQHTKLTVTVIIQLSSCQIKVHNENSK